MNTNYKDIKDMLGEPTWWDENGVPRYCDFSPKECGVYINIAAYLLIECQLCCEEFEVANAYQRDYDRKDELKYKIPYYGDPPFHGCVGDTMTSNLLEVVEVWRRDGRKLDWRRDNKIKKTLNEGVQ